MKYIFSWFFHLDTSLWHEIGDLESEFIRFFQNQESLTEKISHFSWKIGYFGHFWPSSDHCNDVRRNNITIWWYLLVAIRIHILLSYSYNLLNTCTPTPFPNTAIYLAQESTTKVDGWPSFNAKMNIWPSPKTIGNICPCGPPQPIQNFPSCPSPFATKIHSGPPL